jgi:hypothetical protein
MDSEGGEGIMEVEVEKKGWKKPLMSAIGHRDNNNFSIVAFALETN